MEITLNEAFVILAMIEQIHAENGFLSPSQEELRAKIRDYFDLW